MPKRRDQPTATPESSDAQAKQIGIRVPAHMGDQLDALAQRENNSVSAVVRRLLTGALDRENAAHSTTASRRID